MTDNVETASELRRRLRRLGLSAWALAAAWPDWWSADAERSPSARAELRFELARRLGLDARSLVGSAGPAAFLWHGGRFKHLRAEGDLERSAISSFGTSVGGLLIEATAEGGARLLESPAIDIRLGILRSGAPYVGLPELLALAWADGIPVVHLQVFPLDQKRMAAMSVRRGGRSAVLLAKDARYPAPLTFYIAHELGHIALGHVTDEGVLVDFEDDSPAMDLADDEERAADAYAIALLTGDSSLRVEPQDHLGSGREIARTVEIAGREQRIDPGVLAQLYGYSTNAWDSVGVALRYIYGGPTAVAEAINGLARTQLTLANLPPDAASFLERVLGRRDVNG